MVLNKDIHEFDYKEKRGLDAILDWIKKKLRKKHLKPRLTRKRLRRIKSTKVR